MQASLSDASMASRARLDNVKRLFAAAKADDVSSFAGAMDAGDFDVDARLFMSVGPGRYSIPLRQRRGTATCLHVASSAGCRRVVAWLLSAGARPRLKDGHNNSALAVAANDAIVSMLTSAPKDGAIPTTSSVGGQALKSRRQPGRGTPTADTGRGSPGKRRSGLTTVRNGDGAVGVVEEGSANGSGGAPAASPEATDAMLRRREAWLQQRRKQVRGCASCMHFLASC